MTDASSQTQSLVIEQTFAHPPEKVWRAISTPHLMEAWLMKNNFDPTVGHHFDLHGDWGGTISCEVLEITANRLLSYTWNYVHEDAAFNLESVVTFTLTPTDSGTLLRVEQVGFRPSQKQALGGAKMGWKNFLGKLLPLLDRIP